MEETPKQKSRSRSRSQEKKNSKTHSEHSRGSNSSSRERRHKRKIEVFVPDTKGPLLSFKDFLEIQKVEIDRDLADKIYSKYKARHEQRHIEMFFYEHKVMQMS